MSRVGYDGVEAVGFVAEAAANLDGDTAEILTCHVILQREMMKVIRGSVPRGNVLRDLKYEHALNVMCAVWRGEEDSIAKLDPVLNAFGLLRNAVAHPKQPGEIEPAKRRVVDAFRAIDSEAPDDISFVAVAQGICAEMGDGPSLRELAGIISGLENLTDAIGRAFAVRDEASA